MSVQLSQADHNGVLFLDEFPEFRRNILDLLRHPLEDGQVTIARAAMSLTYPARFMLIAAMNPCPCGYSGDSSRPCTCSPNVVQRYRGRISGPILDRIDLHIEVPSVRYKDLQSTQPVENSVTIRDRVIQARKLQLERFSQKSIYIQCPHEAPAHQEVLPPGEGRAEAPGTFHRRPGPQRPRLPPHPEGGKDHSGPLAGEGAIAPNHLLEAAQYRSLDRRLF
jgi:magnesium chelatase family protein